MSGIELAGALDRLHRRLRLDELARAAKPERAISTEFTPDDGPIFYEDAGGMVHRKPIAQWIAFMSARMYAVARGEANRAFNEKSVPDQEANRPLEDGLRLDALNDLAFRWDAVFEAAKEHRGGRGPLAGLTDQALMPDPAVISFSELSALHDVSNLLHELCHALKCQPRCGTAGQDDNPARVFVDRILDQCSRMMDACEKQARRREPASPWEADERLCIIARAVIENGDSEQILAFARDVQAVA